MSEVKNIMVDNIEKVLERGEKIELLVDKTDNLRFQVRDRPHVMRSVIPQPIRMTRCDAKDSGLEGLNC